MVDAQRALGERLTALETRDAETAEVLTALMAGTLIPRDQIALDPQARRAMILRDREAEGEQLSAAIDRTITAAQLNNPGWIIVAAAASAATEAQETAVAP